MLKINARVYKKVERPSHMRRHGVPLLLGAAMLLCGRTALSIPLGFQLSDDGSGPTCANFLSMGSYAWRHAGGDWLDAHGVLQGAAPFDRRRPAATLGRQVIDFDVTAVVQRWMRGQPRNSGILLSTVSATDNGVVTFHSRESPDIGARPGLKITWSDGSRTRLAPAADTFLDCTSLSSLGARPDLQVGGGRNTLMVFAIPPSRLAIRSATLFLTTDTRYGLPPEIGVFAASPPYALNNAAVETGLAEKYLLDSGIARDPDVLFATGFEGFWWSRVWTYSSLRNTAAAVDEDVANAFKPLIGRALKVTIRRGHNLGLDLSYEFAAEGYEEPEEIYVRYYLRFGDNWNPSADGGKLPGLAGRYGKAGWGLRKSDGYNGWSMRSEFAARPAGSKAMRSLTAVGSYADYAEIEDATGATFAWSEGPSALLENNRWYAVEQHVKLNTIGKKDGEFTAWIDGHRVIDKHAILYRRSPKLRIEEVWFNVYHGGITPAAQEMALYFDNLVVARRYIGPLRR